MPTFKITAPDGRAFNVTGDNADGALAALQQHLGDVPSQSATAQRGASWQNDPIIAQSADGVQHQFPANTDPAVIDRVMKNYVTKPPQVGRDGMIGLNIEQPEAANLFLALRNAHNAGDTVAAQRIAGMINAQQGMQSTPNYKSNMPDSSLAANWSDLPGNILPSAGNAIAGVASMVAHPLTSADTMARAVAGGIANGWNAVAPNRFQMVPQTPDQQRTMDVAGTVGRGLADRYGGLENLKNTLVTDPIGSAVDVGTLAMGGEGLLGRMGLEGSRAAQLLGTVSRATNPVVIGGSLLGKGAELAGKATTYPMGLLSGGNPKAFQMAAAAGAEGGDAAQASRTAFRGQDDAASMVNDAHGAIDNLAEQRRANYLAGMKGAASSTATVDTTPIRQTINDLRDSLYHQPQAASGENTASFAPLQKGSNADIKTLDQIDQLLAQWEAHPEGRTPMAMDALKQRLDELQPAYGNPALDNQRRLVTAMQNAIKDQIVSAEPSYAKAMQDYAGSKTMQKELQTALGLGPRAAADTAFTKLNGAMNGNRADRAANIAQLEQFGAPNLMNRLAGQSVSSVMPKGGVAKLASTILGGTSYFNPTQLALLPFTSPRFNAELAHAVGRGSRRAGSLLGNVDPTRQRTLQMLLGGQLMQGAGAQ